MANIHDVAKAAGVAISTVSRAFNNYPDLKPETRDHILQVAKELGYQPNKIASNLASKRKRAIGLIIAGFTDNNNKNTFLMEIMQGVFTYVREQDLELSMYPIEVDEQLQTTYRQFCLQRNLAGAIITGISIDDPYFRELIASDIPCVAIDQHIQGKYTGYVESDNYQAAYLQAKYLTEIGHESFMLVEGSDGAHVTLARRAGYLKALQEANIPTEQIVQLSGNFSESRTYELAKSYFQEHYGRNPVTAILCMSDLMALALWRVLKELNYSIPRDFSLAGFDGNPLMEYIDPPIATVKQPALQMGYESAKLLMSIIRKETSEDEHKVVLPSELQWNASCDSPRSEIMI